VGWDTVQTSAAEQQARFRALLRQFLHPDDPLLEHLEAYMRRRDGNFDHWEYRLGRELRAWDHAAQFVWSAAVAADRCTPRIDPQDLHYYEDEPEPIDFIEGIDIWFDDDDHGIRRVMAMRPDDVDRIRREVAEVYDGPFVVDYAEWEFLVRRAPVQE
jgi:hypothetical protein